MQHGIRMKFAVFGRNGSILIFLFVLALISSISFADSAPPPPSQVTVHLVSNGVNETSIGQIVYHCTVGQDTYANEGKNISLTCSAGTCINTPYYMASECVYFPVGYFSYEYQGQNKSSENFNATKSYQQYYEYQLDVQTGRITSISASNKTNPDVCSTAFLMFAAFIGFFISKRDK